MDNEPTHLARAANDWIERMRHAGNVRRCHTMRVLSEHRLSEHSFNVAILILALEAEPSAELLKAALYHDLAESVTGDVPAPTKWSNPSLEDQLRLIEAKFRSDLGLHVSLTEKEVWLLKFCDKWEFVLWCREQHDLGNSGIRSAWHKGLIAMGAVLPPDADLMIHAILKLAYNEWERRND